MRSDTAHGGGSKAGTAAAAWVAVKSAFPRVVTPGEGFFGTGLLYVGLAKSPGFAGASLTFRSSARRVSMSFPAVAGSTALWRMQTLSASAEVFVLPGVIFTCQRRVTSSEHASHYSHDDMSLLWLRMEPTLTPTIS